jgi:glycosyltransferase involved in cell wall biosynthesis
MVPETPASEPSPDSCGSPHPDTGASSTESHARQRVSVIVPVYNEEATVEQVIRRVLASPFCDELIVIDDGSEDASSEILDELHRETDAMVLVHRESNGGKGVAVREGIARATGDIILIQDADLEYDPADYAQVLQPIIEGRADAVYGSRFQGAHRAFTFGHYLGNKLISVLASILFGKILTDVMTCYKAMRSDIIKDVPLQARSFDIETEITAKLLKRGARVYEVPISYAGRSRAKGKKIRWYHAAPAIWALLKYRVVD